MASSIAAAGVTGTRLQLPYDAASDATAGRKVPIPQDATSDPAAAAERGLWLRHDAIPHAAAGTDAVAAGTGAAAAAGPHAAAGTGAAAHTIPCLSKRRESSSMIDFLDQNPSLNRSHLDRLESF